jgi:hypothetical protein
MTFGLAENPTRWISFIVAGFVFHDLEHVDAVQLLVWHLDIVGNDIDSGR